MRSVEEKTSVLSLSLVYIAFNLFNWSPHVSARRIYNIIMRISNCRRGLAVSCVCVCVCTCVRARIRERVRACVRARVCVRLLTVSTANNIYPFYGNPRAEKCAQKIPRGYRQVCATRGLRVSSDGIIFPSPTGTHTRTRIKTVMTGTKCYNRNTRTIFFFFLIFLLPGVTLL